jgi:T5SS/PEP-CTERM-associated repeat protein
MGATVSGAGSKWLVEGALSLGDGPDSAGLSIRNGGYLFCREFTANFATILIDGPGSLWETSGVTRVGLLEPVYIRITNGARVSGNDTYLGVAYVGAPWPDAQVDVRGSGSLWSNSGTVYVGHGGSEALVDISSGGKITAQEILIDSTGTLSGDGGTIVAEVINGGQLSAHALAIDGDYAQLGTGRLRIQIDGGPGSGLFDMIDVSGQATVDGTLILDFTSFTPPQGSRYQYLVATSIAGEFDTFDILGLDPALLRYDTPTGSFTIVPEPATLSLLALGGLALLRRRGRK